MGVDRVDAVKIVLGCPPMLKSFGKNVELNTKWLQQILVEGDCSDNSDELKDTDSQLTDLLTSMSGVGSPEVACGTEVVNIISSSNITSSDNSNESKTTARTNSREDKP